MQTHDKTKVKMFSAMDPHSSDNKGDKQVTQVVPITDLQSTIKQIVQEVMSESREKGGPLSNTVGCLEKAEIQSV